MVEETSSESGPCGSNNQFISMYKHLFNDENEKNK